LREQSRARTLCSKKYFPSYFVNNSVKKWTDFNNFGRWNPRKFYSRL